MSLRQRARDVLRPAPAMTRHETAAPPGQLTRNLALALERIFRNPRPEILDLGPLCGQTASYLARRGGRIQIEPFEPPAPLPARRKNEPPPKPVPFGLDLPDKKYDLVLAWEQIDFVPPERLKDYGAELRRIIKEGGWLYQLSLMKVAEATLQHPWRYRLLAADRLIREATSQTRRRRWVHPTRDIERALAGFSIQGLTLQRNQMREFIAVKAGIES